MAELVQYANGVPAVRFSIDKPYMRIGRTEEDNDICIPEDYVSKHHAVIEVKPSVKKKGCCDFYLRDLGSTNCTVVNKDAILLHQLCNNDIIYIGKDMFQFQCDENEVMLDVEADDTVKMSDEESQQDKKVTGFSRRLRSIE